MCIKRHKRVQDMQRASRGLAALHHTLSRLQRARFSMQSSAAGNQIATARRKPACAACRGRFHWLPSPRLRSRLVRTFSASSAAAVASAEASVARLDQLFSQPPTLCLERAVGERAGADSNLWQCGAFRAEVYPDLPIATSWRELLPLTWQTRQQANTSSSSSKSSSHESAAGSSVHEQGWRVQTVAAQLRSSTEVQRLLLAAAAGSWPAGARAADAVLCVSGSHPVRLLPGASSLLWSSFDTLRLAAELRERGQLPASLSLWAVENPMLNPVSRLQRKADAGAQVVLTQPPLLWDRSRRWVEEAAAQGLTQRLRLVVGVPMASSTGNLEFWLHLCGARNLPGAEALLAGFPQQPQYASKEAWQAAVRDWNAALIRQTLELPMVAGLHVMPLNKTARQMTLQLLHDGTLPGLAKSQPQAV